MKEPKVHFSSSIKSGVGQHIYLMFAGRRQRSDSAEVRMRPGNLERLFGTLLVIGTACMIGVVLWHQIFAAR